MNSLSDIKHAFYINLESRPDRKTYVETEFAKIGMPIKRFNAIKLENGAIGCSMSHLKIIEDAKKNNLDHVLIVEDDIQFTNPALFINQLNLFFKNHTQFDVVLIGGNNMPPFKYIDDSCVKVTKCQTTTGYLVKNHYYDTLIHNYRNGIKKLINSPTQHSLYAIDKYWFNLQEKHDWYLIVPLTVTQREDYSDIEKRKTNYSKVMLDLDKVQFFKEQKQQHEKQQHEKQQRQIHRFKNITTSMSLF